MDILGVGVPEFIFILIIALIVLGPRDMVKAGKTLGQFMRKIVTSPSWRTVQQASNEIRTLPNKLMREAGLEEIRKQLPDTKTIGEGIGYAELHKEARDISKKMSAWTTPPNESVSPSDNKPMTGGVGSADNELPEIGSQEESSELPSESSE